MFGAAVISGLHQASLWSQVVYLWDHGWTITNWHLPPTSDPDDLARAESKRPSAHRLRYFLSYPLFSLGAQFNISAHTVFTGVVPLLAAITMWSVAKIVVERSGQAMHSTGLLAILPVIGILAAMDGRLLFAYCGYAMLLASHLTTAPKSPYLVALCSALGLFLTSVSSGTFFSAFAALVVLSACAAAQASSISERLEKLIPLVFCALLYYFDLAAMLIKNLTYYGGGMMGWKGMAGHGFGTFFLDLDILSIKLPIFCLMGALLAFLLRQIFRRQFEISIWVVLLVSISVGMFGYSALSLALIPACLLAGIAAQHHVFGKPATVAEG
ncbi:hypothetical protein ACVC7O_21265 (plasmid) [Roseobacter sp. A03A-229]